MKTIQKAVMAVMGAAGMVASQGAGAHAYVQLTEVNAGWRHDIEIRIPHGCKGSPTTQVRVKIPEGVTSVRPEINRNWKISMKMRKLPKPVKGEGGVTLTETVDEITWSGNSLPDELFEKFTFRAVIPDTPNQFLFFKTIQTCKQGEHKWVEVPSDPSKFGEFMRTANEPAAFTYIVKPARKQYSF